MTSPAASRPREEQAQSVARRGGWIVLAALLAAFAVAALPAHAKSCKVLKSEFVGFGEQSARAYADSALDAQIAAWEAKYKRKAEPKGRKMACKDYIKALNEFECVAEAEVCR